MRRKKQIGPPHFLFWSSNQPPWWIMGNVRSGPCDPPCHLQVNLAVRTTEIEILVNKWMPHFIEQQRERKPTQKPHQPSFLHLHWLGCPASGECGRAHWWTRETRCSAAGKIRRSGKVNLPCSCLHWCCSHNFNGSLSHKTVAAVSCLATCQKMHGNVHFQKKV